jgi:hypothetical protein
MIDESVRWLLSFYRTSEIGGALFFGQLARTLKPGTMQADLTRHFADEAQHASLWTSCIVELGAVPLALPRSYQDRYLATAGVPANLMEVLAITHVFERRVARQYARHRRMPRLEPVIAQTLDRILSDERWHLQWVRRALEEFEPELGREAIDAALARCRAADEAIYGALITEQGQRVAELFESRHAEETTS